MANRKPLTRAGSKRYFRATARKTKAINIPGLIKQRGGVRL